MTCTSMFKTSWKERWRTFNSDWRNEMTWRRKWLFEKSFHWFRKQLRKTESRPPQAEKKIWYTTKKTLQRCEKNFRIWQRKCKIEKMNWKIVSKNSRAWMTKCRMIERLQTIEVWNFIWWTIKRWRRKSKKTIRNSLICWISSRLKRTMTQWQDKNEMKTECNVVNQKYWAKNICSLNDCVKQTRLMLKDWVQKMKCSQNCENNTHLTMWFWWWFQFRFDR